MTGSSLSAAPRRSVLLLGASGFVGPALAAAFGAQVTALTYLKHAIPGGIRFDVRNSHIADLVAALPETPSAAIILLGETNLDRCALDSAATTELNVRSIIRLVTELLGQGIVPVFISSDAVFDGSQGYWREEDDTRPILTYGRQKQEVERYLFSLRRPWLIVRLPKLISATCNPRCMVTAWVRALGRPEPIICATDQYFTPADVGDAAHAIRCLVAAGATGIFHVAGPQRLSRRGLLEAVIQEYKRFAEPIAQIIECSLRDLPVVEPRPLDTSMDTSRFRSRFGDQLRPASEVAKLAVRDCFGVRDEVQ